MFRTNLTRSVGRTSLPFGALALVAVVCGLSTGNGIAAAFADGSSSPVAPSASTPTAPSSDSSKSPTENPPAATPVVVESIEAVETVVAPVESDASAAERAKKTLLSPEDEKAFDALVELYAFAYPLVLSDEIKRETTGNFLFASANETAYFPKLANARYRATEFPNVDALLAIAWLDLAKEPQVLVVPAAPTQAYSVEIVDAWSNVVASLDETTLPERFPTTIDVGGRKIRAIALVGPTTPLPNGGLPAEIGLLESPSALATALTRVFLGRDAYRGSAGTRSAAQTLYEFSTLSLSGFLAELKAGGVELGAVGGESEKPNETDAKPAESPTSNAPRADSREPRTLVAVPVELNSLNSESTAVDAEAKSLEAATSNAVDATANDLEVETESELNAETTPVLLPLVERAPSDRYADDASKTSASVPEPRVDTNAPSDAAESSGKSPKVAEKSDAERGFVADVWDDVREDGREALDSIDAGYRRAKRWFKEEFGSDANGLRADWDAERARVDADFRDDRERFDRDRRTFRASRRWFEGPVERVARTSPEKFVETFAELLKDNPPVGADATVLDAMKTLDLVPGEKPSKALEERVRKFGRGAFEIARKKIEVAAYSQIWRNATPTNWIVLKNIGDFGTDYRLRAAAASMFFGADDARAVVYPFSFLDANGARLDGANDYVLRFPAGSTPPTDFLWSLTLYDADRYLAPNRWEKYGVRSDAPLVYNPDGSLDVLISRKEPKENPVNWIPAPRGPFTLTLRIYRPREAATNGSWTPPAVEKLVPEPKAER